MTAIARKITSLAILLFVGFIAYGQKPSVEMADGLRAEGKIYVIVAIILIVLTGLVVYLFAMDRKIKKLEDLLPKK